MLPNCPKPFYLNCANALKRCRECRAARPMLDSALPLHYQPILGLPDHPAADVEPLPVNPHRSRQGAAARRRGLAFERKQVQALNATPTTQSGRIFNDGDMRLTVNERTLTFDSKLRTGRSFSLSKQEYIKAVHAGIDGWILGLTNGSPLDMETCVLLTFDAFLHLIAASQQGDNNAP